MTDEDFTQLCAREFRRMKGLADKATAQISPEHLYATLGPNENSVAVIMKHMAGNLRSRWTDFLHSDGEKPDRNRDAEFILLPKDRHDRLRQNWEDGWRILFDTLESLSDDDLSRKVSIRGEPLSVLQAITRQLTHYSYHVGQIVYLAKHFAGEQWQSLSIPLGDSARFNAAPEAYLK